MEAEEEARRVRQRTEGGYGHGMVDAPQPNMGMEGMGGAQPGAKPWRGGAVGRSCLVFLGVRHGKNTFGTSRPSRRCVLYQECTPRV